MSESARGASCPTCGAEVAADANFCPDCGSHLETGSTVRAELPPNETGPVPVSVVTAPPTLFGVTPPMTMFALGAASLGLAVVLLVLGHWVVGLALLGVAFLFFAVFLEVARRKPGDAAVARASVAAVDALRAHAGFAAQSFAARSGASLALLRLRQELAALARSREQLLRALGDAVYREDSATAEWARGELQALDAAVAEREAATVQILEGAQAHVARAALEVQPTEVVSAGEPPVRPRQED